MDGPGGFEIKGEHFAVADTLAIHLYNIERERGSDLQSVNAGFNSTCYHPPRGNPRGFAIFFLLGGLFPTPGHAERDNSPPPELLIDHKHVVLCSKLPYNSTTRRFDKNLSAFLEFTERRILHSIKKHGHYIEKENS